MKGAVNVRFNEVGIIIGQRGTGKTLFLLGSKLSSNPNDKALNKKGILDIYLAKGMKVLIIDTLDHPSYSNIPILKQKDFYNFKSGVYRVVLDPDNIPKFIDLINRSPHMNNTLIVCEDAGKYTGSNLNKSFKRLIIDTKQRNIDLIFMYHCFIDTPANIFTKIDFLQLFKTEDTPEVRKSRMRLYQKVFQVWEQVNNHVSKFYGKYIDTRTN
jgi:predicted AAA+ superfamily ATPase